MQWSHIQTALIVINLNFLVLSIFLFRNKNGNATSNKILSLILFLLVYVNTHFAFLYDRQFYLSFPHFIGTHTPFLYLIPPMVFFYYKSVFDHEFTIKKVKIYHFIPFVIMLVLYVPLYFSSVAYKVNFIKTGECYVPNEWLSAIFFLQFVGYLFAIFMDISKTLRNSGKDLNRFVIAYFNYTRILAVVFLGILITVVLARLNIIYIPIFTAFIYYYVIYQVLVHPEIFFTCKYVKMEISQRKYQSNELPSNMVNEIYQEALTYIKRKKVYLEVKISLPQLAYQLNIPAHQLSQAINRKSGLNFNDFINKFRSEHCRDILMDERYQHYTMEAIAELSGFKTRQTFIKSFKKFYNQTPSEYIKYHKAAV